MIGWFGIPGSKRLSDSTVVHAVVSTSDPRPLCGARLRKDMQLQRAAFGYDHGMIECANCRRVLSAKERRADL